MHTLPINGRIVIIDDHIDQALPIMQELGKRRLSYTYYDGSLENLPEEGVGVDVRLIFLDINIFGESVHTDKQLGSAILGVLGRILGDNCFPYVLVCWSRNQEEFESVIKYVFDNYRRTKPIATLRLSKTDFFTLSGNRADSYDVKINDLFHAISEEVSQHVAFSNLLRWENIIHNSTNKALREGLACIDNNPWDETANWIFTKLGVAYSGRNFKGQTDIDKLHSSFHTLNQLLQEIMEEEVSSYGDDSVKFLTEDDNKHISLTHFNERLIFTFCQTRSKESGRIVITAEEYSDFKESLNFAFTPNLDLVPEDIIKECANEKQADKALNKYYSSIRKEIRQDWDIFKLVINAPCDFAQNKIKRSRVIPGFFVKANYRNWFKSNSDALFISPVFFYRNKKSDYFFILDFRYLSTENEDEGESDIKLKQVVLAEILSKLSRHINRQGLLTLDLDDATS